MPEETISITITDLAAYIAAALAPSLKQVEEIRATVAEWSAAATAARDQNKAKTTPMSATHPALKSTNGLTGLARSIAAAEGERRDQRNGHHRR